MKKIIDYISKGRGIGALWLLIFSAVLAFHSAYTVYKDFPLAIPYIQKVADELLPIKIENSKLVVPENTVKTYTNDYGGQPFSIVIDSTRDMLEEQNYKPGFYLTRSYMYTINNKEVKRQNLIESLDLPRKDYTTVMEMFVRYLALGIAICGPFFYFLCFLIAVWFYAFCTGLACALNKVELNFKTKMRLNTLLFIGVYLLSSLCYYLGLNLSLLAFFLIMIGLQIITVKKVQA